MSVKISSLNTASTIDSGDDINIAGNNPLAFSDWGGGWFMEDTVWIRSVAGKSLWMGAGVIGADGGLTIGYGGGAPPTYGAIIAGNVGIGTASPLNLLHVSQASANTIFRLGNNASYDQFIYFNGGNDWSLGMDYSNSNAFVLSNASSIGTNDRLVVTTGGNVGIGTSSPSEKLHIYSSASSTEIRIENSTTSAYIRSQTDNLNFYFNGAERMRIASSGNVGIGTSTPKSILEIVGNLSVTHTNGSSGYSEVLFYENNTLQADIFVNGTSNTNYAGANSMNIWQGSNAPIAFYTNGTNERMRIAANGYVGIGTNNPQRILELKAGEVYLRLNPTDIAGAYLIGASDGVLSFIPESTYVATLTLSSGKVGIGTRSPAVSLHVIGDMAVGVTPYNGGLYASSSASAIDPNWGFQIQKTPSVSDYNVRLKYYPQTGEDRKGGIYNSRIRC